MGNKKRKPILLQNKENYYNIMIAEINKKDPEFDINKISNGEYCFYDFINFLKLKDLYNEFEDYVAEELIHNIWEGIATGESEIDVEKDLPFTDLSSYKD